MGTFYPETKTKKSRAAGPGLSNRDLCRDSSHFVGLSRQLSNPMHSLERLLKRKLPFTRDSDETTPSSGEGSNSEISSSDTVRLHSHKRLTPDAIASVFAGYQDGQTTIQLAEQFGVNRRTISKALTDASGSLRGRPLTEQQIDQAVLLYESGLSLAKVGRIIGAQGRTIQLRLRERGVRMRDTHGRYQD